MSKIIFILFAFLAVQVKSTAVNPRDLVDEVNEQLDELENTVQGNILAARNDLGNLEYDFLTNSDNTITSGGIQIQQEQESVNSQLNTIKDLANSVNVDISACTDIREEVLSRLPAEYINLTRTCVFEKNRQEADMLTQARYIIDVSINKVHNLRFQCDRCNGNIMCLSPLVTEIELDKVRLPQDIKIEVSTFDNLLGILKVLVQECSDSQVAQYAADAGSLMSDITACVNRILG